MRQRYGGECSSAGRAPDCGSGGRGFKSLHSPQPKPGAPRSLHNGTPGGPLAQLVEQLTLNQRVRSSSLRRPTNDSSERLGNLDRQNFDVTRALSHVTLVSPCVTSRGLFLRREPLEPKNCRNKLQSRHRLREKKQSSGKPHRLTRTRNALGLFREQRGLNTGH
jgi:hypothetical protein